MSSSFWLLLFLTVTINMGVGLILPIMPILMKDFGFSTSGLSLAFFALVGSRFIFQNVGGHLIHRIGSYKILGFCFFLYALIMGVYPFILTKELFVCFRALEGIFEGFAVVSLHNLAIEHSDTKTRGRKMGYFSAAFGLGFILGPSLGGIMFQNFGKYGMFWSASMLSLIGFLGIIIAHNALDLKHTKKETEFSFLQFNLRSLALLPLYGPQLLRRVLFFSFQILLPLYAHEYLRLPAAKVGILFTMSAILTTALMPLTGRASDIIPSQKILRIQLLIMGSLISSFGFIQKQSLFVVAFILETLAFCFMLPAGMKIFGDAVMHRSNKGQILGFFGSITDLCTIVIPFIILPLYNITPKLSWMFLGGLCITVSLPFWRTIALENINTDEI